VTSSADPPPDGLLEVGFAAGAPDVVLKVEIRMAPFSRNGADRRRRIRTIARMARGCLEAAHRILTNGSPRENETDGIEAWRRDRSTRRSFYELFELLFRRLLRDVQGEGERLILDGEQLRVAMHWRR